jgi:N-acetylglutamate synthase-like GNAT family acetyltransferase
MTIREATLDDLDALTKLFDSYREFYGKSRDLIAAKKFLHERMSRKESIIYVAQEKEVVGFAQLYPLFSSTRIKRLWLLNDLFVNENFRGKGISKLLIEKCFELAKETDSCGVMLETERGNTISN